MVHDNCAFVQLHERHEHDVSVAQLHQIISNNASGVGGVRSGNWDQAFILFIFDPSTLKVENNLIGVIHLLRTQKTWKFFTLPPSEYASMLL